MEVLDTSIANVALPHIAGSLSAGTDESTWVLTSYLVSNAIVLPMSGWLSSIFGRKRFYMSCVAVFTISSFLCGFAPNLTHVDRVPRFARGRRRRVAAERAGHSCGYICSSETRHGFRGLRHGGGAGAGDRADASAVTSPTISVGAGFFTSMCRLEFSRCALTYRLIQDPPFLKQQKKPTGGIDYFGLGLLAVGLGALQILLDKGQRDDWFQSNFITISVRHRRCGSYRRCLLGAAPQKSDHRFTPVQESVVRRRQRNDVYARRRAIRHDGAAAAICSDADGLHRAGGRSRADARRIHRHAVHARSRFFAQQAGGRALSAWPAGFLYCRYRFSI